MKNMEKCGDESKHENHVPLMKQWRMCDVSVSEKLEKFVEDVK